MKYSIDFVRRGVKMNTEIESDNEFQAVADLCKTQGGLFDHRIEILSIRSINEPMELVLGREYTTTDDKKVVMKGISNPGTDYETMYDQHGHHRYSRSQGRIIGRLTGTRLKEPGHIKLGLFWSKHDLH